MLRIKCLIFYLVFFSPALLAAVSPSETNFISPIRSSIRISGNFGELRGGHFHAGLDIKGTEGDNIYSSEVGFVSRIKIQRGGYGRAVYVQHPNGYTTVYAHLRGFNSTISEYVLSQQRAAESYEIDINPGQSLPLDKGELLGFLGNSGHSFGAHLHFEVRESVSDNPMNPMLFNILPSDDQAPVINSVRLTGLDENFKKYGSNKFSTKQEKAGGYQVLSIQTSEPIIGLSIAGFDRNNFGSNRNGLYKMKMYVNDVPYYSFNMNAFSFEESHLIETHTEYEERASGGAKEIACYRIPGNQLSIIDEQINNGLIYLQDSVTTNVQFVLTDYHGNTTTQNVRIFKTLGGERIPFEDATLLAHGIRHEIQKENFSLVIHEKSLPKDIPVPVSLGANSFGDPTIHIGKSKYPVLSPFTITATIPDRLLHHIDKLGLVMLGSTSSINEQTISGNQITTSGFNFGTYGFFVDTVPPKIIAQNIPSRGKITSSVLRFKLTDNITTKGGLQSFVYTVFLDGSFVPCELKETTDILTIPMANLVPGEHSLLIRAVDKFGNEAVWERMIELGG